jgi:hypothetical protein
LGEEIDAVDGLAELRVKGVVNVFRHVACVEEGANPLVLALRIARPRPWKFLRRRRFVFGW